MHASSTYNAFSKKCLEHALSSVPGYADWRKYDPGPTSPITERFASLPTLTKQQLRDHFPRGFIPVSLDFDKGMASGEIEFAQTSGSTDDKVTIIFHPRWWEASEQAAWQLNSHAQRVATGQHREVVLASPLCVGPGFSHTPLTPHQRTIGRHLYLNQKINPASWTDDDIRQMADELSDYRPATLEGDPAYLAAFSLRTTTLNINLYQPQLIFLTYSYPSRLYRRRIQSSFSAPQVSSYGSTETGHVFMECEAGRLHQNTSHCRVDFEPWISCNDSLSRGRLLVSVFHNPWFAVLRFDIGDVARLDNRGPCPCGRHEGLTLASIDGRTKDVSFSTKGRAITVDDIDASLAQVTGVEGWQIDIIKPNSLQLRILTNETSGLPPEKECRNRLFEIYGDNTMIEVLPSSHLEHESSGKFRFVRSSVITEHNLLYSK